jgi:hypothetical protein
VPLHPDPGQPRGLGVAADGEGAPAERRPVEQMTTSVGMPRTSPEKNARKSRSCTIWVRRLAMISARPRAAASIASVAMKATSLP